MAEGVNVGKLVITISGDTKDLETAAKRVGQSLQGVQKDTQDTARVSTSSFANMARSVLPAISAIGAVAAAFQAFRSAMSNVTALDNLSQATGVSIQRLSELRGIALQIGVDFEALSRAVAQFGTRMTEQLAQPGSLASQAVRALGISIRDAQGNIRGLDDLLPDLADRFSQFADGANKTQLAIALFGEEAGPRLIPLLNRGRAGLEDLRRALGQTVSQEDIERARQYQTAIGQMQVAWEAFSRELVALVAGPVTTALGSLADVLRRVREAYDNMNSERGRLLASAEAEERRLRGLIREWESLQLQAEGNAITRDEYVRQSEALMQQIDQQRAKVADLVRQYRELEAAQRGVGPGGWVTTVTPEQAQAPRLDPNALAGAQAAYDEFMQRIQGSRSVFDELNLSWRSYADVVAEASQKATAAFGSGIQGQIRLRQSQMLIEKQYQQQALQTAQVAGQAITALFPKSKAAAIAAATINTAVGITKAFTDLLPPMNWIQAGLVAAMGAAQIATINSTSATGGGSTPSVGGSAPSAAAPAEPAQAPPGRVLTIQGLDPATLFSGRQMEELIRAIGVEVQNGATLIATKMSADMR